MRFEYRGKYFHWYNDGDRYIRIASEDKKFVVAYLLGDLYGMQSHLEVTGQDFPGIAATEERPVRICVPKFVEDEFKTSFGAFVNALIRWCLQETHQIKRYKPNSNRV
ncbi:MAG: hypothetical protein AAGB26_08425 [Planctomycetota bacterium]